MGQPDGHPARSAQPGKVPVLDTKVGWTHLYADPQVITYGKKSIALDEVEWVSYWTTVTAYQATLRTGYETSWTFMLNNRPFPRLPKGIHVVFHKKGRNVDPPEEFTFLVNLSRQYLEPRLLADLVARVRRGETVTVASTLKVNKDGISCSSPRVSLSWGSISDTGLHGGAFWIFQTGVEKSVLNVPLSHPNAALIPALFDAVRP